MSFLACFTSREYCRHIEATLADSSTSARTPPAVSKPDMVFYQTIEHPSGNRVSLRRIDEGVHVGPM